MLLFIILLLISKFRVLFFFFSTPYFSTYLAQFMIYMVRSHPSSSSIFSDSTALGSHGILSFFFIYLQQFLWTFFILKYFSWEEHWAKSQECSFCHLISQIYYLKDEEDCTRWIWNRLSHTSRPISTTLGLQAINYLVFQ